VKLKWYQQFWFKIFIVIVVAVVSVLTMNPGAFASMSSFMNVALPAIIKGAIIGAAVSAGVNLVVNALDIDNMFINAVIAIALFVAAGQITGTQYGLANAKDLISTVGAVSSGYSVAVTYEMDSMTKDFMNEMREIEAEQEEIEKAWEENFPPVSSSNMFEYLAVGQDTPTLEDPNGFLARTLNTNPGTLIFAQIEHFADRALDIRGVV